MQLILLPGLDSTGNLFRQFIHALPPDLETQVVCYPATGDQRYATLLDYVRHRLPLTHPSAESFSGPLAYALATDDRRIRQRRLTAIATLPTVRLEKIAIPCIYLQASADLTCPSSLCRCVSAAPPKISRRR